MKKICASLFALLLSLTAMADVITISKCGGDSSVQGYGASGVTTISAATQFSADEMAPLKGGNLVSVRAFMAATNMTSLEIWVKNDVNDTKKLASKTVTTKKLGWNEVTFDSPIEITGDEPIAIGYTFKQTSSKPCYALTFSDKMSEGGIYLSTGGAFDNYSGYYGNLSIEASVTGVTIEDKSAKILHVGLDLPYYQTGQTINASVQVQNSGVDFETLTLRLDCCGKTFDKEITCDMTFCDINTFQAEFTTPEETYLNAEVTATIVAIDGEPYNSNSMSASFAAYEKMYDRTVVVEEGTGTWCGWCVRGMVAMELMREKYPDTFIGIAAHTSSGTSDPMNLAGYASNLGIEGFPGCTVDRYPELTGVDVDPTNFEQYYQMERARQTYADFTFYAYINDDGKIAGEAKATFDYDKADADVRMTYVLVEDGITGYNQTNYYAGGTYGVMGGFESKPSTVKDLTFNDVARALYPSFKGVKGSLANDIEKGNEYTHEFEYTIPTTKVKNKENLTLVALMIEGATGEIINAHKVKLQQGAPIDAIDAVTSTPADKHIYNLNGQPVNTPHRGLYIVNGKKVVVRF